MSYIRANLAVVLSASLVAATTGTAAAESYKCWQPGSSSGGRVAKVKGTELPDPTARVQPTSIAALKDNELETDYRWIGQLFIKDRDKADAAAMSIEKDVLITAAHNVYSAGSVATALNYYPRKTAGDKRSAFYEIAYGAYPSDWERYSTSATTDTVSRDYAVLFIKKSFDATIGLGPAPAVATPFQILSYTTINKRSLTMAIQTTQLYSSAANVHSAAPSKFEKGASGGAWVYNGKLFSVFSHGGDDTAHGPHLSADTIARMIDWARKNCDSSPETAGGGSTSGTSTSGTSKPESPRSAGSSSEPSKPGSPRSGHASSGTATSSSTGH